MQWAIKELRFYLWGHSFEVEINRAPFQWLECMKETNPRLMHWYLALQPYVFYVHYHKERNHTNVDFFFNRWTWPV